MPQIGQKKGGQVSDTMSKTIDFSSSEFNYGSKKPRYEGEASNRKSIRLKKLDKKDQ